MQVLWRMYQKLQEEVLRAPHECASTMQSSDHAMYKSQIWNRRGDGRIRVLPGVAGHEEVLPMRGDFLPGVLEGYRGMKEARDMLSKDRSVAP